MCKFNIFRCILIFTFNTLQIQEHILNTHKNQRRNPSTIARDAFTFIFRIVVDLPALWIILFMHVLKLSAYVYKSVFFFWNLLPANMVWHSGDLGKNNLVVVK